MSITKDQITAGLLEIGACWAVSDQKCILPGDGYDAKPTYHVHPDSFYPHERYIQTFSSLQSLWSWVKVWKKCAELENQHPHNLYRVASTEDGNFTVVWESESFW